jgi:hypothetical protein
MRCACIPSPLGNVLQPVTVRRHFHLALLVVLSLARFSVGECRLPNAAHPSSPSDNADNSSTIQGEPLLPESGVLSEATYTSLYFGFSINLPIPLEGHRIMLPIRLPGEHALLGIGFQKGKDYGTLVITAGGRRQEEDRNMTPEQAQAIIDEMNSNKPGGSAYRLDYTPPPVHLKRVDKHAGDVRGTQFSARLRNYSVRFTIQTTDRAFLEKARKSIEDIRVFCTDTDGEFFTPEGKPFKPAGSFTDGPTIPTAIVDESIRTRPAEQTIPAAGYFARGEYRIPQLDVDFSVPPGWMATGIPPDPPDPSLDGTLAQRMEFLWTSCARTLFRATAPGHAADGPGAASSLELRVLDQSCLALPAPASGTDWFASESLGEYLQMLGHFGKVKSDHLVESGGHLFSVYRGTVIGGPPVHNLEQRATQAIVATRHRKLIFAWIWSAPTESELKSIPASSLTLGDSTPIAIGPEMPAGH